MNVLLDDIPNEASDLEPVYFRVTTRNKSWIPARDVMLHIPILKPAKNSSTKTLILPIKKIPHGTNSFQLDIGFLPRGRYRLDSCAMINTSFPFAFMPAKKMTSVAPRDISVYPHRFPIMNLSGEFGHAMSHNPIQSRPFSGSDSQFFAVREYRHGDSMRHIDWRSSARHGQLIVREFETSSTRSFIFAINDSSDFFGSEYKEKLFEKSIRIAASMAEHLLALQWSVGIYSMSASIFPLSGAAQRSQILDLLIELNPVADDDYASRLYNYCQTMTTRHTLILFFNSRDTAIQAIKNTVYDLKALGHDVWLVVFQSEKFTMVPDTKTWLIKGDDTTGGRSFA